MVEKMTTAMQVAGFDADTIDLPLLVGALAQIKRWAESEPHLLALGKQSLCEGMRKAGREECMIARGRQEGRNAG